MHNAERRVKKEPRKIVPQPHAIRMYNKGMGGVDVCDRKLCTYRPRLRNRKWWWNIFTHVLNLSVVAAHGVYNRITVRSQDKMDHHDFHIEVAETMTMQQVPRKRLGGPSGVPPKAARYDGINHHLVPTKQGRCVHCLKNTRLACEKCEVRLHKAFCCEQFHKK